MLHRLFTILNEFSMFLALFLILYVFWIRDTVPETWTGLTDTLFRITSIVFLLTKGYAIYTVIRK